MTSNARLQPQMPPDAAARAKVLDPTRSFIVQAPAGSGKTELLMQRYLTLLAHETVTTPESVLAITFTRKAAAEMRNRVLKALESANGDPPQAPHKVQTWDLARKVLGRDRALGWNILQNPEQLEIRTVDSFCEKIANRSPLLAGLGRSLGIAEDFDPLYAEAAQRTLLMLGDDNAENREAISQVLRDQDNSFERVQGLIVELLKRRDQWLRLIGGKVRKTDEEQQEIRVTLERALSDAIAYELREIRQQIEETVPQNVLLSLIELARFGATNVDAEHPIVALRDGDSLPGTTPNDLPRWNALSHFCLTDKKFRKAYNVSMGFPRGSTHKERKDACCALMEAIAESAYAERFCAALCRIAKLPPAQYTDSQWQTLLALFRVLPLAVAHLRMVFAERGEVDHTEVALAAKAALTEDGHPTDLALHLGYKIQHLLVDEFQDTSLSQAELLAQLIAAWSPEMDATMFVVGDPMQSIYGFRQAEVTLFSQCWNAGFHEVTLQQARLTANFRSRPELVEWFNRTFAQVLTKDNDVTGAVKYAASEAAREGSARATVEFHSAPCKQYEAEAQGALEIVKRELESDVKSIAILVRSRKHVAHIAPALREAVIPFRSKEIDVLGERQTVRDLHAMTKALLHLGDRTAWLTLLRGPWCGLELADLWTLCRERVKYEKKTIWELLQERRDTLSERGQQVLARVMPLLETALAQHGRGSLRALVESLWISLGGPAATSGTERAAKLRDAETYLDLLQKVETFGEIDEKRLEQEIENLYTRPDTTPAIRVEVMTIHGAKGLEFDVVIVPGLNRRTDRNRTQLLNWRERVIGERRDLLLAPMEPLGTDSKTQTIAKYITMLGDECTAEETKRLLYVATTRAKERLHLVTTMPEHDKAPEKGSMLSLLPAEVLAQFPQQPEQEVVEDAEPKPRKPNPSRRLAADWHVPGAPAALAFTPRYPVAPESVPEKHTFERVGEDLRRIGTVTHRFLQQIGDEGPAAWNEERLLRTGPVIRAVLTQEGIRPAELGRWEQTVLRALRNTLAHDKGQWILQQRPLAQNEYGLTATLGEGQRSIKVDRTFVEDDVRWLIDYKTSDQEGTITERYMREQEDKYREDLARYAKVLHAFDGREVRGGLYFPLLQIWREVKFSS